MTSANTFLIMSNAALALWYVTRKCLSRQGIELNHILAFTWGFLFYWIFPVALGTWRVFDDMPGMSLWYQLFDGIDDSKLTAYLLISLVAYLSFVLGTEFGGRHRPKSSKPGGARSPNLNLMNGYLLLAALFLLLVAVSLSDEFFKGYTNIEAVEDLNSNRTIFSAVMSFSVALWILYASMCHQKSERWPVTPAIFANRFLVLCAIEAVLAMSMGSRYFVLSGVFMFGTYCSTFIKKWSALATSAYSATLVISALAVGALRTGLDTTKAMGDMAFAGLTDAIYGAYSLTYFLREYSFGVLRWPAFLLSDYVYLVPRVLLPMKDTLLLSPEDRGFHIESPVGGMHSFFSCMVNFGALGTVLFFFLFFYGMGYLKSRRDSILARATYSMISGWLLISFFRNPFEVSLVKDIFQMSVIVPAFVLGTVCFFSSPFSVATRIARRRLPHEQGSNSE